MQFAIPAATSLTNLFVIKTDHYTVKDTGEIRASVQALSPIPQGAFGNARGYEVTEYPADASVLDQIDLSAGPVVVQFESQVRPMANRYGRTTNTQVLVRVVPAQGQQRPAQAAAPAAQPKSEAKA